MSDYLDPTSLGERDTSPSEPRTIDARFLSLVGQQLIAAREAIDASLLALSVAFGEQEPQPTALSSSDVELECEHPRDRRQTIKTIGTTDGPEWRCRDCGHTYP